MTLAYFVSAHGLGHAARACEVMKSLSLDVPLLIRSDAPEWFFRTELARPFTLVPGAVDAPLVHRDSITIDRGASLAAQAAFLADTQRAVGEGARLVEAGVRLVVSDAPALALSAAREARVASVLVSNFTWADIYRPFLGEHPEYAWVVSALEREYATATLSLVTELALDMPFLRNVQRVPLIYRRGTPRVDELARAYGLERDELWLLYYPGTFGLDVHWPALPREPKPRLLTFAPFEGAPADCVVVERDRFGHADVVASVDAVVSKPGYMLSGECMAAGTPLIVVERDHFAEDAVLLPALSAWGGLVVLSREDFAAGRWHDALSRARALTPPALRAESGARVIAEKLSQLHRGAEP